MHSSLLAIFIGWPWDLTIRLFHIPGPSIPALEMSSQTRTDFTELLRQAVDDLRHHLRLWGCQPCSAFRWAMLNVRIEDGGELRLVRCWYSRQSVPKTAIAPLFVVWFGFGIIPKVICIPAWLLPVASAVQVGRPRYVDSRDAGQLFSGVPRHNPLHAMPAIFSGLEGFVTLAVVGAVVGEFVGSNSGIGYVMQRFRIGTFDLPTMFAALVILALSRHPVLDRRPDRTLRHPPGYVSQREDIIFAS